MKLLQCPKCEREGIEPQWHAQCKITEKNMASQHASSDKEHLHYFCRCGYDWTTNISKEDLIDDEGL